MRKKKWLVGSLCSILMIAGIVFLPCDVSGAYEEWRGNVNTNINLRQSPDPGGKIITGLSGGEKVLVKNHVGNWYQVVLEGDGFGYRGWAYSSYIIRILNKEEALYPKQDANVQEVPPEETLAENTLPKDEKEVAEPAGKEQKIALHFPVDDRPSMLLPVAEAAISEKGMVFEEKKPEPLYLQDPAGDKKLQSTEDPKKLPEPLDKKAYQAVSVSTPVIVKEKQVVTAALTPLDDFSGTRDFIGLILRLSTVVLSCLALILSYKAFHISKTSRDMAGKLEYIKKDIDKYLHRLKEKRNFQRKTSLTVVDFVVQGRAYNGYIHNISPGGAFIETRESFQVGREITMTFPSSDNRGYKKKNGEIVRTDVKGIGVGFFESSEGTEIV